MNWNYLGVGLGLFGIGITIILAVPPPWWPKMPPVAIQVVVLFGFLLVSVGLGLTSLGLWPGLPDPRGPIATVIFGTIVAALGLAWWVLVPSLGSTRVASGSSTEATEGAPGAIESYRTVDDQKLKIRVALLASQLRTFEAGVKKEQSENGPPFSPVDNDRQKQWNDYIRRSNEQYAEATNEFRRRFLPTVLALREEMMRRLGRFPPYRSEPPLPALKGTLAGPTPITDLANYLEELARELP